MKKIISGISLRLYTVCVFSKRFMAIGFKMDKETTTQDKTFFEDFHCFSVQFYPFQPAFNISLTENQ